MNKCYVIKGELIFTNFNDKSYKYSFGVLIFFPKEQNICYRGTVGATIDRGRKAVFILSNCFTMNFSLCIGTN